MGNKKEMGVTMVEKMRQQLQPHIDSGLLVPVLDTAELAVFRLADTGYVAFCDEVISQSTGMYIGFNLIGTEFDMLMHYPRKDTYMSIMTKTVNKRERVVVLTDELVEKFTALQNRVAAMEKNPYINFALEAELIEISKKALAAKKKWWQK